MKYTLLALCCWPLLSIADEGEIYKIKVDWADSETLSDSVVQMCDDTYYSAVEIIVPGKAKKDFVVDMDVDITSGKLSPGCRVSKKDGRDSVTYSFDADSSCTVRVYQLRAPAGTK